MNWNTFLTNPVIDRPRGDTQVFCEFFFGDELSMPRIGFLRFYRTEFPILRFETPNLS